MTQTAPPTRPKNGDTVTTSKGKGRVIGYINNGKCVRVELDNGDVWDFNPSRVTVTE